VTVDQPVCKVPFKSTVYVIRQSQIGTSLLVMFIAVSFETSEQFYHQIRARSPMDSFTLYVSRPSARSVQQTSSLFGVIPCSLAHDLISVSSLHHVQVLCRRNVNKSNIDPQRSEMSLSPQTTSLSLMSNTSPSQASRSQSPRFIKRHQPPRYIHTGQEQ
jgi:hypothetical protein